MVPENIHTPPTEGIGNSRDDGGSGRAKNLKQCMKLNWNFRRGGEVKGQIPSVGGMDIFWNHTLPVNYQYPEQRGEGVLKARIDSTDMLKIVLAMMIAIVMLINNMS